MFPGAVPLRLGCLLPLALLGLAGNGCPRTLHAPAADAGARLQAALQCESFSTLAGAVPIVHVTIVFPDSGSGRPTVLTRYAGPHDEPSAALGPASPKAVLDNPGLYLALIDAQGRVGFVASIGDPREVLNEWVDPRMGHLTGRAESVPGGAAAVRIPAVAGARWSLFEVDDQRRVSVVHGEISASRMKPPKWQVNDVQLMRATR